MPAEKYDILYWLVRADTGDFPPKSRVTPAPFPMRLKDAAQLSQLFSTGAVGYYRAIARSYAALTQLRDIIINEGNFRPYICTKKERDELWLRYPGDDDFKLDLPTLPPKYAAINPRTTPHLFDCDDIPALVALEELHRRLESAHRRLSSAASCDDRFGPGSSPNAEAAEAEVRKLNADLTARVATLRKDSPSVVTNWATLQIERCQLEIKSYRKSDGAETHSLLEGMVQWEEVRSGKRNFAEDAGMLYAHEARSKQLWQAFGF